MSPDPAPATTVAGDVSVSAAGRFVAVVELQRPPENFFDLTMIRALADAYQRLDEDPDCRAIVLCSAGKHFCAGANFAVPADPAAGASALYREAARLFEAQTPVVAAVQGAAIGGGLGLACSADFRIAAPEARFAANFARLGFHQGFGLTVTLPHIVGPQPSLDMLYTGRRVPGEEAARTGLADRLVPAEDLRAAALDFAAEIAASAPLAVRSIRETMRGHLAGQIRSATEREAAEQNRLRQTADFAEGVRATAERRTPRFEGR
jgi:2-(1,2-epoxy-1,2-dihydrophenyl)acetyl-CoA isomerase